MANDYIPQFEQIEVNTPDRNAFNLSHSVRSSMNFGKLYPIFCEKVVPGDSWQINTESFIRTSALVSPVMGSVNYHVHFFFVPNRIIWKYNEEYLGGGKDGLLAPVPPYFKYNAVATSGSNYLFRKGTACDYMGIPPIDQSIYTPTGTTATNDEPINMLPFFAYNKIYADYYLDENLGNLMSSYPTERFVHPMDVVGDLDLDTRSALYKNFTTLRYRSFEKDYFTSALPFVQRGQASAITLRDAVVKLADNGGSQVLKNATNTGYVATTHTDLQQSTSHSLCLSNGSASIGALLDPNGTLSVSNANFTINDLRKANALQRFLERDAIAGYRNIEIIYSHFGIMSEDNRLQRSEYLGGMKTPITIGDVVQTEPSSSSPAGSMAGKGTAYGQSDTIRLDSKEYGWLLGIASILPRTEYHQGLPRKFSVFDRFSEYWPEYAHLGEQEVLNKELWFLPTSSDSVRNDVFGYQSKYVEYKQIPNRICGEMRDSLSTWNLARTFSSRPTLNNSFVLCNPDSGSTDMYRVFAYTGNDYDHFYVNTAFDISVLRMMPIFGTPAL